MSMNTSNVDLVRLLPQFMREDGAAQGIGEVVSAFVREMSAAADLLAGWDKLEQLPEEQLDEIAFELNLSWYDKAATASIKQNLIRDGIYMHSKLGTKWAVENIINTYFGSGFVREWFEYGGEPGHFRAFSSNPDISEQRLNEFLSLLDKVKRASAHLDGVYISLVSKMQLNYGIAVHDTAREMHRIGADIIL